MKIASFAKNFWKAARSRSASVLANAVSVRRTCAFRSSLVWAANETTVSKSMVKQRSIPDFTPQTEPEWRELRYQHHEVPLCLDFVRLDPACPVPLFRCGFDQAESKWRRREFDPDR